MALADGRVDDAEERVLEEIARGVGVDVGLVTRTIAGAGARLTSEPSGRAHAREAEPGVGGRKRH